MDIGLRVPLGTEGVFTGNEQEAQMACERFPGNIHNFTGCLILTLGALENHLCLGSCVLMLSLLKNNSKNQENKCPADTDLYNYTDLPLH